MSPRASKRRDIERAALALFGTRGFHGTSMPDLAEEAGVGPGTIYRHFESKEALVNEMYQHWKAKMASEVYANLPVDVPWRERFRALWRGLFQFDADHHGAIDFLDLQFHSDYLDASSRALEQQSATLLFTMITMAQAEQIVVDLPPPAVVALVYSSFVGLVRAQREGYLTLDDALIDAAEERVWAMIRR
ncbi:MAG: TetR/AcrR family transcriptional regulator [Myxococcales bacterium]|nr:TetR/AcrR family transcriptional regulator [Myxococcales bacterium]